MTVFFLFSLVARRDGKQQAHHRLKPGLDSTRDLCPLYPRDKKLDWPRMGIGRTAWNGIIPTIKHSRAALGRPTDHCVSSSLLDRQRQYLHSVWCKLRLRSRSLSPPLTREKKEGRFLKKGLIGLPRSAAPSRHVLRGAKTCRRRTAHSALGPRTEES